MPYNRRSTTGKSYLIGSTSPLLFYKPVPRIFSVKLIARAHESHLHTHTHRWCSNEGRGGRTIRFNRQFSFQPFSTDDFDRSAIYPLQNSSPLRERERGRGETSVRGRVVPYANSFYCRGTESRAETWTRVNGRPSSLPALISFMPSAPARPLPPPRFNYCQLPLPHANYVISTWAAL